MQGTVTLGSDYQWSNNASDRYLDDLDLMRLAGLPDDRPFSGPLEISFDQNNGGLQNWLSGTLGVTLINNTSSGMSSQWTFPGSVSTYRLYSGGPQYTVPMAPSTISTTLQADPVSNPLGLFYQSSDVTFNNNAVLNGTVIGGGHVFIAGSNVSLSPVDLMPLQGSTNKFHLPTLLASNDIYVNSGGGGTINGLVATFDKFNLKMCPRSERAHHAGKPRGK